MGNRIFKCYRAISSGEEQMIKVVTSSGGIMELYAPIAAGCITNQFPGHAIFPGNNSHDHSLSLSQPLRHNDQLLVGKLYYLLPLPSSTAAIAEGVKDATSTPYRVSLQNYDSHDHKRAAAATKATDKTIRSSSSFRNPADVYPRYNGSGVWKVRLVINPEQLAEILSQDTKTEELIDCVRTVANCGTGAHTTTAKSFASSDHNTMIVQRC